MTKSEVMSLLKANRNERGLKHWDKMGDGTGGLESFGIGLTQLRKLAKKIGRDHELAQSLWRTDNHDAKVVSMLIDEPEKMTREQVEEQVEGLEAGMLAHVFSSCDATLAKAPFAIETACDWIESPDAMRRRCGYGLIYEFSKIAGKKAPPDEFFLDCIHRIRDRFQKESTWGRMAMGGALMGIGKRSKALNRAALELAKEIGPIDFSEDGRKCDPFDVVKHLTSDYLKQKLGI